jgi:hypothetical protein
LTSSWKKIYYKSYEYKQILKKKNTNSNKKAAEKYMRYYSVLRTIYRQMSSYSVSSRYSVIIKLYSLLRKAKSSNKSYTKRWVESQISSILRRYRISSRSIISRVEKSFYSTWTTIHHKYTVVHV